MEIGENRESIIKIGRDKKVNNINFEGLKINYNKEINVFIDKYSKK